MSGSSLSVLQGFKRPIEPVVVNGATFYVRGLGGDERAEFIRAQVRAKQGDGESPSEAKIVALTLVEADGTRVIPDGDERLLVDVDGSVIFHLAKTAYRVSGLLDDSKAEAEKNSDASQS
jgi:hypothetical protein